MRVGSRLVRDELGRKWIMHTHLPAVLSNQAYRPTSYLACADVRHVPLPAVIHAVGAWRASLCPYLGRARDARHLRILRRHRPSRGRAAALARIPRPLGGRSRQPRAEGVGGATGHRTRETPPPPRRGRGRCCGDATPLRRCTCWGRGSCWLWCRPRASLLGRRWCSRLGGN